MEVDPPSVFGRRDQGAKKPNQVDTDTKVSVGPDPMQGQELATKLRPSSKVNIEAV